MKAVVAPRQPLPGVLPSFGVAPPDSERLERIEQKLDSLIAELNKPAPAPSPKR